MADKENSAAAAAKLAAAVMAAPVAPNRKRVALSLLPTHPNPLLGAHHDDDEDKPVGKQRRLLPAAKPKKPQAAAPAPAAADDDDPHLSMESDICSYLRSMESEARRRPDADYMAAAQFDLSPDMRAILIDWLVEVAEHYKLVPDTLCLAVSYIDRFLSKNAISRRRLQLLGVSAMLVASKYEEMSPPKVEDFCWVTDYTYPKQEIVDMGSDILKNVLKYECGSPTAKTFLGMFIRSSQEDNIKYPSLPLEFLGSYLCELTLLDYSLLCFLPSLVAASVLFVARLTLDPHTHPWSKKMQTLTGYEPSELKDCVAAIHQMQRNRKFSSMMAIREKYKQRRFMGVSALLPPVEIPASYFSVSTTPAGTAPAGSEAEDRQASLLAGAAADAASSVASGRPKRSSRPNTRFGGPEWVTGYK